MNRTRDLARKLLSLGLATLLLTLSVAIPVLERGELSGTVGIESSHDPGRCGHVHDHRICTQLSANLSLVAPAYDYRVPHVTIRAARPEVRASTQHHTFFEGPPSRAPPLA
jgi:hypothetical protein